MPSPFPGMDPYLESPDIWPDFHNALAGELRGELNQSLPAPYYARLEMRPEIGIVEDGGNRPDVAVVRRPRSSVSDYIEVAYLSDPIRHHFVEIRDPNQGHKLITLIEIVSPSHKRDGSDRQAHLKKQGEVLRSDANLIEIDLLRTGERLFAHNSISLEIGRLRPKPDYLVMVSRAWKRRDDVGYQVFPCTLREMPPCIPVPLRDKETEVLLDLQFVFNRAYDGGPYRRGAVNYSKPPNPALGPMDAEWAKSLLEELPASAKR